MDTTLKPSKQLLNREGYLSIIGETHTPIKGYEIHCGVSQHKKEHTPLVYFSKTNRSDCDYDGVVSEDNAIIGTYLHGLFDHPESLRALLMWAGLSDAQKNVQSVDVNTIREEQLERLADSLEECMRPQFWQQFGHLTTTDK